MSTVVDRQPSPFAIFLPEFQHKGETIKLWVDYVQHDVFAWGKGLYLVLAHPDGVDELIAISSQKPASMIPTWQEAVDDMCRYAEERFNEELNQRFPGPVDPDDPHPLGQEQWERVQARLGWDRDLNRFTYTPPG